MKDIARDLGVSVMTVSKALHNHVDVSAETRDRVLQRMKELDYRPNLAARSLVTGKSHMVGLVVPDLVHPFFSQLAKGISRALRRENFSLVISSSEEDADIEKQEIDRLLDRSLDLLIIASTQKTGESFHRIEKRKQPYVLVDRKFEGLAANFIGIDDRLIGHMATEHLIENGCRSIAYIGGENSSPAVERLAGYRETLERHRLPIVSEHILQCSHGDDSGDVTGYESMNRLLKLTSRPDGVFCWNDPTAMGAMKAIIESGYRIPHDIAVIGCGNVRYASELRVSLSSIDQESEAMGELAAKLALRLLNGKPAVPSAETILMRPTLIVRSSSLRNGRQ